MDTTREWASFSRRSLLVGAVGLALRARAAAAVDVAAVLQVNDLDRRIWFEELDAFVPARMWDMHAHIGLYKFDHDPQRETARRYALAAGQLKKEATLATLRTCDEILYPGRMVMRFILPTPYQYCDCKEINAWAAEETRNAPDAVATMVVQPGMSAEYLDEQVRQHRFVGFKPYMWHAKVPNWYEARITDFLPEHQIEVGNHYGLVMALHLARRGGGGDPDNLADLERLSRLYPKVRWLLLHNARCYFDRPMERAAPRLRQMPNVWIEGSTVCEADALFATFTQCGTEQFCYGSDDFYAGVSRGKYISWGEAWTQFDDSNFTQKLQHCDDRKTFVRYEMLRALKRAAKYAGLKSGQVEDIFFGNGARLVEAVKSDLNRVLGQSNRS